MGSPSKLRYMTIGVCARKIAERPIGLNAQWFVCGLLGDSNNETQEYELDEQSLPVQLASVAQAISSSERMYSMTDSLQPSMCVHFP